MINKTIHHYKILDKIGEGGMGVVYKAQDTKLDRQVALKFLPANTVGSPEEKTRFEHEAKAAAKLSHANIAHVYEINEHEGETFIAMEYIDGETLAAKIEKGPLRLQDALQYAIQMAEGLLVAHEAGIVHRDIKSQNIMVTTKDVVKIMDFGLAKVGGRTQLTKEGTTLGTVAYMSPEQSRGDAVDGRSDIFSLSVLIYEMLTAELPFKGDYEQAVIYAILNEDPVPITGLRSGIPLELERIVFKGMAKEADARYQTVTDLLVDLRSVQKSLETEGAGAAQPGSGATSSPGSSASASPSSGKPASQSKPSKGLVGLIVGAAALLVLVAVLTIQFGWRKSDSHSAAIPISDKIGIAILPFDNVSQDPEDEYFADGMTDELISKLSGIDDFRVIARTSAMQYKGQAKDITQIGAELRVDHVVEGTVRRAGDNLRITVQLVNVASQAPVWSTRYDRRLDDIFAIQDEISLALMDKLQITLLPEEQGDIARHDTENIQAYNLYLQGRFHWNKRTKQDLQASIEKFKRAIELDPGYALAYAGLADAYIILAFWAYSPPLEMYPLASEAALKALEINPNLAEAHTSLAFINSVYDWDWSSAKSGFNRAIELKPSYAIAHQWYSEYLVMQGDVEGGLEAISIAQNLDPLSPIITSVKGEFHRFLGQSEMALEQYNKVLALNPDFGISYFHRGVFYAVNGQLELAQADLEKALVLTGRAPIVRAFEGWLSLRKGDSARTEAVLAELIENHEEAGPLPIFVLYYAMGKFELAMDWFEMAYERRESNLWLLWGSGGFPEIESNPRFQKLLDEVGLTPMSDADRDKMQFLRNALPKGDDNVR